jgi:mRNA interferase MazF
MKQAEIWYADLNPSRGSEQKGFRPVVVISGNLMNEYLNTVICCPLTTKIKNYKGNVVLKPDAVNKLKSASEILTAHIRSVSKERLVRKIGRISDEQLREIKEALNDMLRY